MTTGQRIKEARKQAKMTQKELAQKLGIPFQGVSQWENDLRTPKPETLQRIARVLRMPVQQILGEPSWLNENLRFYREVDGVSRDVLSAETGIPVSEIRAFEDPSAVRYITEEHLQKILDYFQVSRKQMLGHSVTYEDMIRLFLGENTKPAAITSDLVDLLPSEFNEFERFIETLGYYTKLDGDNYRLHKGKASVIITPEQLKALVRASKATVTALVQDLMETATPPPGGSEGPQEGE